MKFSCREKYYFSKFVVFQTRWLRFIERHLGNFWSNSRVGTIIWNCLLSGWISLPIIMVYLLKAKWDESVELRQWDTVVIEKNMTCWICSLTNQSFSLTSSVILGELLNFPGCSSFIYKTNMMSMMVLYQDSFSCCNKLHNSSDSTQ